MTARNEREDAWGDFLAAIEEEQRWITEVHHLDKSGQSASDQRALASLAEHVRDVGEKLGLLSRPPKVPT